MLEPVDGPIPTKAAAAAARRSRVRFAVLALISIGTLINYLDRAVLGIAAPPLARELHLSAAALGLLFSAFSWTYAAMQVPGGMLLDRFGTRMIYGLALGLWSLFTLLQGVVSSLATLLGCRLALGAAEAPCFPGNSRVLSSWFPQVERARANGAFSLGQYFGLAFFSPLLFWIAARWSWRALFVLAGLLGLAFTLLWSVSYREPYQSRRVNSLELEHIRTGGGLVQPTPPPRWTWPTVRALLTNRDFLGSAIGQFASNSTLVFFLTWFPTFLTSRHMQMRTAGWLAALPYIAASCGLLLGGWWSDWLIKRTGSATLGRKAPIVTGLCMASTLVLANYVQSNVAAIAVLSFVFFGQGMCNLGWTLITDLAPPLFRGLTTGLFNLCTNLAGIVTPLVIGLLVGDTHSFGGGLAFVSAVAVLGVLCYLVVLGPVRQIELPQTP